MDPDISTRLSALQLATMEHLGNTDLDDILEAAEAFHLFLTGQPRKKEE